MEKNLKLVKKGILGNNGDIIVVDVIKPKRIIGVCGSNGSPGRKTFDPFAYTVRTVAMQPINFVQVWFVKAKSLLSLDTAGIVVFIDTKNRLDYNLNLENWPFLTSCLMPPTMYDSTSVSCGATCNPFEEIQCCVQGSGLFLAGIS